MPVFYPKQIINCLILLLVVNLSSSCTNEDTGAYEAILQKPAFAALSDSIKKDKTNDSLYFRRAVLLNQQNFPEVALEDFNQAWQLKPTEIYAYAIGNLLLLKDPKTAIAFIEKAKKKIVPSERLYLTIAQAFFSTKNSQMALAYADSSIQKNNAFLPAHLLKVEILEAQDDVTSLTDALQNASKIAPQNKELRYLLAYQLAESKNAKAVAIAHDLIAKDTLGVDMEPYYILGIYYVNIGNQSKALSYFNQIIARDYNYLNAYIEKGKIQLSQGQTTAALKTFTLANTISPSFPDAFYWIGKSQELLGKKDEARANYEKAYALDKTFTAAKEALNERK